MARGSDAATGAATSAQNLSNQYSGNASALFGPLSGMLESEAAHPTGIDPATMGRMDTASMESAGGGGAGAMGSAALRAARTRNAGGADASIQQAARTSGETATRGILANRVKSAELQEQQRRAALSGLGGLYSENVSGGNQALRIVPDAVRADTEAAINDPWNQFWSSLSSAAGKGIGSGLTSGAAGGG